jgi:hypothetical protein
VIRARQLGRMTPVLEGVLSKLSRESADGAATTVAVS